MKWNLFFLIIVLFLSCQSAELEYPLELAVYGPYPRDDYSKLQDSFWMKRAIDEKIYNFFYIMELENTSSDTLFVAVSKDVGNIWCYYLCFTIFEESDCMVPGEGVLGIYDFKEWDPLSPKEMKRYFYPAWSRFENCEFVNLSLEVKSPFFDSLNKNSPVCYSWLNSIKKELNHPLFFFTIEGGVLSKSPPINIQKELDRTMRKIEKLNKRKRLE